jgi:hypothetical protein
MNDNPEPINVEEMTGLIQRAVNADFGCDIALTPDNASFEITTPSTGQWFRVTVETIQEPTIRWTRGDEPAAMTDR